MVTRAINTDKAPKAIGPYSQAIFYDSRYTMELSGQIGIDPTTGKMIEGGLEAQTRQVLENMGAVLERVGWDFSNIVKTRIYLTDMANYATVNRIYAERFRCDPPARVAVAVSGLPADALIEIEAIAAGSTTSI